MIGTTFGNSASSGGGDADAAAFISAAAITGTTQKSALNQLVLDLKGTGSTTNNSDVFSELYALYPTCPIDGSTQTLTGYSFNIVDPLSYQITWVNAPTFDSTGVIFTGTQYGNTNFDIATDPDSFTSFGAGVDVLSFSSGNGAFMGAYDGGSQAVQLIELSSTFGGNIFDVYTVKATLTGGSNLKSVIRRTLSDMESYENGISVNTNTTTISTPSPSSAVITIAARSSVFPKTCKLGVSFISKGLSDNQSKDLFDSITTYNTALGRWYKH